MKIDFHKDGKIGIIKIFGRLDAANSRELKEKFQTYLEEVVFFVINEWSNYKLFRGVDNHQCRYTIFIYKVIGTLT